MNILARALLGLSDHIVQSGKLAKKIVPTGWHGEKRKHPMDHLVHIRELAHLKNLEDQGHLEDPA
jgi:hypothetical protein